MGPKSTLRLIRTLGPSLASLAQSTWSFLSNALAGNRSKHIDVHTMKKCRKLNTIQNNGQSQAKEQSTEISTKANQNNNSIIKENAQFEGEHHIQEESHVESHTSLGSASESSTKGEKRTRGYTHMLDVGHVRWRIRTC
ncbi:hypothetical protein GmHk_20G057429 [Glycine max]|nr:hypothetical protein GmHk_20G057429 [Glycine max]